jgi:hypothetical protein
VRSDFAYLSANSPAGAEPLRDNEAWGTCRRHGRALFRIYTSGRVCVSCQARRAQKVAEKLRGKTAESSRHAAIVRRAIEDSQETTDDYWGDL